MKTPSHEMVRRVAAAQKTLDRFMGQPFGWGTADCSRMVAFHLRQMGFKPALARFGSYKTAIGARAALKRAGFETLGDVLDAMCLVRIPPAAAIVGDIVQGDSGEPLGALGIYLGNGAMLGFHEDAPGATTIRRLSLSDAWSVA